jgi:hypothetical protein
VRSYVVYASAPVQELSLWEAWFFVGFAEQPRDMKCKNPYGEERAYAALEAVIVRVPEPCE